MAVREKRRKKQGRELLTCQEAAERLNFSHWTLRKKWEVWGLTQVRLPGSRKIFFYADELDRLVEDSARR